jgi:hypothetical protein
MYLSGSEAAKAAGVAKSTISKALHSGKLSYAEKRPDGYKIDPAELFRVFPKPSETGSEKPHSNDWKPDENPEEAATSAPVLEAQLESLKALIAEKERRIADLEADREQLRDDRERLVRNHQADITRIGSPSTCVSWAEQPYLCPASADTGYSFEEEIKSRLLDSAFSLRYLLSRFRRIGL